MLTALTLKVVSTVHAERGILAQESNVKVSSLLQVPFFS